MEKLGVLKNRQSQEQQPEDFNLEFSISYYITSDDQLLIDINSHGADFDLSRLALLVDQIGSQAGQIVTIKTIQEELESTGDGETDLVGEFTHYLLQMKALQKVNDAAEEPCVKPSELM